MLCLLLSHVLYLYASSISIFLVGIIFFSFFSFFLSLYSMDSVHRPPPVATAAAVHVPIRKVPRKYGKYAMTLTPVGRITTIVSPVKLPGMHQMWNSWPYYVSTERS